MPCDLGYRCNCLMSGPHCPNWVERPMVPHNQVAAEAMDERQKEWDQRFIEFARQTATWSKDPSTQVGAVLVDGKRRIIGTGFNGFPRGVDDLPERYADRPTKYAFVVHAEMNAILTATMRAEGATLYSTHAPCNECAKHIIQAGIVRVVAPLADMERWRESHGHSHTMFREAGVKLDLIEGV